MQLQSPAHTYHGVELGNWGMFLIDFMMKILTRGA
jgi:hypothetical protein